MYLPRRLASLFLPTPTSPSLLPRSIARQTEKYLMDPLTDTAPILPFLELQEERESNEQGGINSEESRLASLQRLPWYRRPSVAWLLPLVFLLAIVMSLAIAPQGQMTLRIICKTYLLNHPGPLDDQDECSSPTMQAYAAVVASRMMSLKSITAILTLGYYTSRSDRLGRKYLIYLSMIPTICSQLLLIHMNLNNSRWNVALLYVNALITGCLCADEILQPALLAYIADCTLADKRSMAIGNVMMVLAVGMILGPVMGAYLMEKTMDIDSGLVASTALLSISTLYITLLPESLVKVPNGHVNEVVQSEEAEDALKPSWSPSRRAGQFLADKFDPMLDFLPGRIKPTPEADVMPSRYTLSLLVLAYVMMDFSSKGTAAVFIPYSNLRYGWTTLEDQIYFAFSGASFFVVYMFLFPAMQFVYKHVTAAATSTATTSTTTTAGEQDELAHERSISSSSSSSNEGPSDISDPERRPLLRKKDVSHAHMVEETVTQVGSNAGDSIRKDLAFFAMGALLLAVESTVIAVFDTPVILFVGSGMRSVASVGVASFLSFLTSYVPLEQTGRMLGGISVMGALSGAGASLVYGWVFGETSGRWPWMVYGVSGVVCWCSFGVATTAAAAVWTGRGEREGKRGDTRNP
ncbi:MAG: major facilitator superfamily domain-containing protein [Benniella sp.]|nr:MAG: major facilitator superfamily domain-containing protein [Benniella sp.]